MSDSSATPNPAPTANVTAGERVRCPGCGVPLARETIVQLDKDSRFSMELAPQANSMMLAKNFGGIIESMADVMKALDGRTVLMIEGVHSAEGGRLKIDFYCARTPAKPSQP